MSVDVTDFRKLRLVEANEKASEQPVKEGLQQQAIPSESQTGHEDFDKFLRAVAVLIDTYDKNAGAIAIKAVGAVQDMTFRVAQCEFMYVKGKVDGLKEASNIPLQILAEKKPR